VGRKNEKELLFRNKQGIKQIIVTKSFDIHQDFETPIPGFFIIEAKRRVTSIMELSVDEQQELISLLVRIRRAMKDALGIHHVILFQDEATEWKDFHLWLFPRYSWMNRFGQKIESVKPIIQYAQENMADKKSIQQVEDAIEKIKEYLQSVLDVPIEK